MKGWVILKLLFSSSLVLLQLAFSTVSQPDFMHQTCYDERGYYAANSDYRRNLDSLLSSLYSNTEIDYGFYNLSVGQAPDQVNAIGLCRGDIGMDDCRGCIRNSTRKILEICPNQTVAIGVYDFCSLRYSNRSIFGVVDNSRTFFIYNLNNASDVNQFTQAQKTLLDRLRGLTTSGNSIRKFATGNESAGFERVYGLMQCSPDLSAVGCDACLAEAIGDVSDRCAGKVACSVIKPSCDVRLNNGLFYRLTPPNTPSMPPPPPPSPLPPPPSEGKKSNSARTIIIIIVPTVSVVILVICIGIFLRIRKPKEKAETKYLADAVDEIETAESLQLDFDIVRDATNNFSDENKLGQGGFGAVYKGTYPNKQEIAVKRLSSNSGQGDLEFKNEVLLLAKLQHRNLIRFLGFCLEGNERLLIYEFLPNTSLDHFVFGDPIRRLSLDWDRRYKIICGIARGLHYLHEDSRLKIIHRDLKASNVLLDEDMNPKISDFGMARLFQLDQSQANTKRIVGTYGYMAPEYAMRGKFSVKSDVFSYGVLLLEIVSGQKNSCVRNGGQIGNLLSYAWKNWREGTYMNVVDPILANGSRTEIMRCLHIGLLCVQENVADRPTIASVVLMLNGYSLTLPKPSRPAFLIHSNIESDVSSSSEYNSRAESLPLSKNEASITQLSPR